MSDNAQATKQSRKRSRPAGKDRVPLTAEQRRARNERERREAVAAVLADRADAAGCDLIGLIVKSPCLVEAALQFIQEPKKKKPKRRTLTDEQLIQHNEEITELYMRALNEWMENPVGDAPSLEDIDSWLPEDS